MFLHGNALDEMNSPIIRPNRCVRWTTITVVLSKAFMTRCTSFSYVTHCHSSRGNQRSDLLFALIKGGNGHMVSFQILHQVSVLFGLIMLFQSFPDYVILYSTYIKHDIINQLKRQPLIQFSGVSLTIFLRKLVIDFLSVHHCNVDRICERISCCSLPL